MMLAAALTGCTGTGTQQESAGQTGQSQVFGTGRKSGIGRKH